MTERLNRGWAATNALSFQKDPEAEPPRIESTKTHEQICKRRELEHVLYLRQVKDDSLIGEFD